MRKVLMGMVGFFFCVSLCCYGTSLANSDETLGRELEFSKAAGSFWALNDLLLKSECADQKVSTQSKYEAELKNYNDSIDRLSKKLLASWNSNDGFLADFSNFYKSLPVEARKAFYPAIEPLRNEIILNSFENSAEMNRLREYFPGYGYSEPGYKYRKGREIEREAKGTTWQDEEQTVSSNMNINLTVTLDVLNILNHWLKLGNIANLVVHKQFQTTYNGAPMFVFNVSFSLMKTMVTKRKRKYEVNKIWFELHKSKTAWGTDGEWELCGKTYEIIQDPTGDEFVSQIETNTTTPQ
ncbi:MAG: hypothetical protein HQM10_05235 [Candidatus Riflebacteria bacterium]|nr:hypothetical protein [Candidatus Riflebacteria bacterium]